MSDRVVVIYLSPKGEETGRSEPMDRVTAEAMLANQCTDEGRGDRMVIAPVGEAR